ncbi:aromatic acid decarboxylase [Thermocladium modestius]|uniref:Flavin prenyltransferase UbiX n=1 Tax=Thermocladium modestius TaxID=62609 RepID=A0A830GVJ5_9CREN|nr:UbiX family flavin prenyltransferase [Thermocladium modestius]GGP22262.1 aromatic acid decarboxylase [Thermocladium modestius]
MRIVLGLTGASGVVYGVRVLEELSKLGIETFVVISRAARTVMKEEGIEEGVVESMASHLYEENDLAAPIASGSFHFDGMAIVPCSMKTLAAIAHGITDNLVARAADVALKERRRLVLVIRESPLNLIHIRNMELVTMAGAIVMPASPPFYNKPKTINDMINSVAGRVLDLLGIRSDIYRRWGEN